ncbi:hypothetical protein [Martelella soudanensis]|uniref:hypothetical protein n=1 Tax=unclassified Martelella TaxID=2629616 RepID=UPI0015DE5E38|nr:MULTISPECIES: hypothetical protein [unclassified Martelella]
MGVLAGVGLALAGCASHQLQETAEQIDVMAQELAAPPPEPPEDGAALGPADLLANAESRGKDFMRARISRARAMLELDKVKSARLPRISAEARQISTYKGDDLADVASVSNIVLGVNWDISKALLRLDQPAVKVAGRLIPVQYQIAQRTATTNLFNTYNEYTALDFRRRNALLKERGLACRAGDVAMEVADGDATPQELKALKDQVAAARREADAVSRSLDSKRDEVLGLAGLAEGGYRVAPERSVLSALSGYQSVTDDDAEACFANSGKKRLEDLLVEAAAAQLDLARQSRLTKLKTSIPSFMTQTGGLNLQFLVSYVLPLIDEGDALRMTQNARLTLLETIIGARDNRRHFMSDFASLKLGIAAADSDLAAASAALVRAENQRQNADPAQCAANVDVEKAKTTVAAAKFKIDMLKSRLRLLCAPLSEKTTDEAGP